MTPEAADFVVVGLGTAGCVLVDRLSETGRYSVLGIEAGGATSHPAVAVPALIQKQPSRLNWLYPVQPDPSRDGIADPYSAGRGLGGSSATNAMLWVRGHPLDFDGWARAGATGWDYASVLPAFLRAEHFEDASAPLRGTEGPLSISRSRVHNPLIEAFVDAAGEAGLPVLQDYNGREQVGASRAQVNQRRGMRHTVADAYLRRARRRRNVEVVTEAMVRRVVVEDGRCVAVEFTDGGGRVARVAVGREAILCAGAIGTPKLLQLSGIGPGDVLAEHGIPVAVEAPEVGANLMEHPATSLVFEVTRRTVNQEVTPARLARHAADFTVRGHGALTTTANHAVAFGPPGGPGDAPARPEHELVFMAFGLAPAGAGAGPAGAGRSGMLARLTARSGGREEGRRQVASEPLVTCTAVALHPTGRGRVTIAGPDPATPPTITQALLGDPADAAGLTAAARFARDVVSRPALSRYVIREVTPGEAVATDADWDRHLRAATFRLFHPAGTCRMGGPDAPLDPRLRVRGVAGLRVADASVMPTLTSGNTQAPVVMIAERGSALILADQE